MSAEICNEQMFKAWGQETKKWRNKHYWKNNKQNQSNDWRKRGEISNECAKIHNCYDEQKNRQTLGNKERVNLHLERCQVGSDEG